MATVVDDAKNLAKHLRTMALDARRIRFSPQSAQTATPREPSIDPIEFRRQGV